MAVSELVDNDNDNAHGHSWSIITPCLGNNLTWVNILNASVTIVVHCEKSPKLESDLKTSVLWITLIVNHSCIKTLRFNIKFCRERTSYLKNINFFLIWGGVSAILKTISSIFLRNSEENFILSWWMLWTRHQSTVSKAWVSVL